MQFKKGLIKKDLKKLKKKEWYHQRFDGCPNLIYLIGQMELKPEPRKEKGGEFTNHLIIFNDNRVDWYIDLADIRRVCSIFIKKSFCEPFGIGKKIMQKWDKDKIAFIKKCDELDKINLTRLSDEELKNLYQDFFRSYFGWTTMSSVIDGFALGSDEYIQTELNKFLDSKKIIKGRGIIFSVLTAPTSQSFINEAEIALLKVALKIYQNQKLRKIFIADNLSLILKKIRNFSAEYQILQKHRQNYFWGKNNYVDSHILNISFFIKEIKELLKNEIDLAGQIKRIEGSPRKSKINKQKLIKKLKLPKFLVNLIEISETFTYWQDERKKCTFLATHCGSVFLAEIGKRFGYSLVEMKCLFYFEVITLFTGQGHYVSRNEARKRREFSFHYDHKQTYEIVAGKEARQLQKAIFKTGIKKNINDFRGLSASSGKVRGMVKIVKSAHEVGKVNSGDILVAVMTRPDYIMGIKKAAAIVTNEGGVTCHAAIIARELGIPCVIATKIATEVLKDGDLVEVNGNHGVVTILKRK
jgi:phosphohistidine swiveling domain-containing protein